MTPATAAEATALLVTYDAPARLLRHNELVLEAAELLMAGIKSFGCRNIDEERVRMLVIFHDAGKIWFPHELDGDGSQHEIEGAMILMTRCGVSPELTGGCYAYSSWLSGEPLSLEQYLCALADKLWRGSRDSGVDSLEEEAILQICYRATGEGTRFADWWGACDRLFEKIADGGPERLERSRV